MNCPFLLAQEDCAIEKMVWQGGEFQCDSTAYQLVFQDEFNQGKLDTNKWFTYYPYTEDRSDQTAYCRTHGKGEVQIYLDENLLFTDSTLRLVARKQDTSWFDVKRGYTSGMIYSKQHFKYGKYEIRFKVPKGRGLWPAFWIWGIEEIDIFEFCCRKPKQFKSNMHYYCEDRHLSDNKKHKGPNFSKGFHTVSVEWEPQYLIWRIDGEIVRKVTGFTTAKGNSVECGEEVPAGTLIRNKLVSDKWMQVIANLALCDKKSYCKSVNKRTPLPAVFEIDYIRVYQKKRRVKLEE